MEKQKGSGCFRYAEVFIHFLGLLATGYFTYVAFVLARESGSQHILAAFVFMVFVFLFIGWELIKELRKVLSSQKFDGAEE